MATARQKGATEILAIDLTPPPSPRRPRTAVGVLRQSLFILAQSATRAMETCMAEQARIRLVRPDLARSSPWRLDDSAEAIRVNLALARAEMTSIVGQDGRLLPQAVEPEQRERPAAVPAAIRPVRWPRGRRRKDVRAAHLPA
jgi:hypothetical protein